MADEKADAEVLKTEIQNDKKMATELESGEEEADAVEEDAEALENVKQSLDKETD